MKMQRASGVTYWLRGLEMMEAFCVMATAHTSNSVKSKSNSET